MPEEILHRISMPPTPPPRGSSLAQQPNGHQDEDIHVLVTGYGPFGRIVLNPSFLICSSLPSQITLPTPTKDSGAPFAPPRRIYLHKHPTELPVAYDSILALHDRLVNPDPGTIPNLPPRGYDWVFHIGVAGGEPQYSLESLARAGTYHQLGNVPAEHVTERFTTQGAPNVIHTGWNDEDVLRRWNAAFVTIGDEKPRDKPTLKISTDAGLFLCEFITYCSLARRWIEARAKPEGKEREGKVAFLHVVDRTDEESIFRGAEVAKAAITALVSSWEAGERRQ